MCANTNGGVNGYMKAYSSANIPWVASRRIMNQHSFFNVNIEDDMTICAQQQDHGKIDALNISSHFSSISFIGTNKTFPFPTFLMYFSN